MELQQEHYDQILKTVLNKEVPSIPKLNLYPFSLSFLTKLPPRVANDYLSSLQHMWSTYQRTKGSSNTDVFLQHLDFLQQLQTWYIQSNVVAPLMESNPSQPPTTPATTTTKGKSKAKNADEKAQKPKPVLTSLVTTSNDINNNNNNNNSALSVVSDNTSMESQISYQTTSSTSNLEKGTMETPNDSHLQSMIASIANLTTITNIMNSENLKTPQQSSTTANTQSPTNSQNIYSTSNPFYSTNSFMYDLTNLNIPSPNMSSTTTSSSTPNEANYQLVWHYSSPSGNTTPLPRKVLPGLKTNSDTDQSQEKEVSTTISEPSSEVAIENSLPNIQQQQATLQNSQVIPPVFSPSYPPYQQVSDTNPTSPESSKKRKSESLSYSKSEKRLSRYRSTPSKALLERLEVALSSKIYLISRQPITQQAMSVVNQDPTINPEMSNTINKYAPTSNRSFVVFGPTGSLYRTTLSNLPSCNCPDSAKGHHCAHILFIFLKVLKVDKNDPALFQRALLNSELNNIYSRAPPDPSILATTRVSLRMAPGPLVVQGECQICFDPVQISQEIIWCKEGCGTIVHKDCVDVWMQHRSFAFYPYTGDDARCFLCGTLWPFYKREKTSTQEGANSTPHSLIMVSQSTNNNNNNAS